MWEGVDFKVQEAEFFLQQMREAVLRAALHRPTAAEVAIQAAPGTGLGTAWDQEPFYYFFHAFLVACRSVPDIVEVAFGRDPVLAGRPGFFCRLVRRIQQRSWFDDLAVDEQKRRIVFSKRMRSPSRRFRRMPLSMARNLVVHRTGVAPVQVVVTHRWGVFSGGPFRRMPDMLARPPGLQGGLPTGTPATVVPVRPALGDFTLATPGGTTPLFATCDGYLNAARELVTAARELVRLIHGTRPLTLPPAT